MAQLVHIPGAAGADEAGRGPLAGPVVAAAVILPEGFDTAENQRLQRNLSPTSAARTVGANRIRATATWWIERAEPAEIDRLTISFWASMADGARHLSSGSRNQILTRT